MCLGLSANSPRRAEFETRKLQVVDRFNTIIYVVTGRSPSSEMRDIIDKGLIAVAQNDFKTAHSCFENALKLEPSNSMVSFFLSEINFEFNYIFSL